MQSDTANIIEIRGLRFSRGDRVIFDGVDMDISRGKITAIMGPSGTGKTTLMRLITGQIRPDAGTILVDGENISSLSRNDLYRVRRKMGMLFQSGALFTDRTVYENVAFPLREHTNFTESMIRDLVLMKLHAVGLRGARDMLPSELSGGMTRRAALARTIALDPQMVFYDEPFAGQDPIGMGVLLQLIKLLNTALGLTSVVVSHDIHETASIADSLYVLSEGKVIGKGAPQELMSSESSMVAQFMNGKPDGPVPFHYPAQDYLDDLLGGGAV
ncbi:MAG: ATP-binding cassette domain-containing protein [Pseudomonadales bacterium]|jgi:phospholipid/cholesterol/gamma-HCH transport system ATP-binding protein